MKQNISKYSDILIEKAELEVEEIKTILMSENYIQSDKAKKFEIIHSMKLGLPFTLNKQIFQQN